MMQKWRVPGVCQKVTFARGVTPLDPPFRVSPQRVRGRRVRVIIGLTRLTLNGFKVLRLG